MLIFHAIFLDFLSLEQEKISQNKQTQTKKDYVLVYSQRPDLIFSLEGAQAWVGHH